MPHCEIYIIRHAIAAERGDEWPDDTKRPLTQRGIERFQRIVAALATLDVVVDEILTSPLVRAKQTADILKHGLATTPGVKTLEALAPGHTPASVMAQVAKTATRHRIAVVGHEPGLGELIAHLIGASRAIPLKKGGACRLDVESLTARRRAGALLWLATPKMLLARGR